MVAPGASELALPLASVTSTGLGVPGTPRPSDQPESGTPRPVVLTTSANQSPTPAGPVVRNREISSECAAAPTVKVMGDEVTDWPPELTTREKT